MEVSEALATSTIKINGATIQKTVIFKRSIKTAAV
jgi:hypothetical protein